MGIRSFHARQNYGEVELFVDGRYVTTLPWQKAQELAKALHSVAKKAEEWDCAEQIASDEALLLRSGAPFGLTNNPRIIEEAKKEAAHNRDLRRYLPGGIKSTSIVPAPTVRQFAPRVKK